MSINFFPIFPLQINMLTIPFLLMMLFQMRSSFTQISVVSYISTLLLDLNTWKKLWCRLVDSYQKDETQRKDLLKIEHTIFLNIKGEVEALYGDWEGSAKQNTAADYKVASSIYSSFRNYERGLKRKGSFFQFKRK